MCLSVRPKKERRKSPKRQVGRLFSSEGLSRPWHAMTDSETHNPFPSWPASNQDQLVDQIAAYLRQQDEGYDTGAFAVRPVAQFLSYYHSSRQFVAYSSYITLWQSMSEQIIRPSLQGQRKCKSFATSITDPPGAFASTMLGLLPSSPRIWSK